jgi:superfamily II DNA/RNA helicase
MYRLIVHVRFPRSIGSFNSIRRKPLPPPRRMHFLESISIADDWPSDDPREYVHRVGRTARAGGKGRALLFLQPSEVGFLKHLEEARVPLTEYDFPEKRILPIQSSLEKLINSNYYLNKVRGWPLLYSSPGAAADDPSQNTVRQRRLPFIPAGICLAQPAERVRCPQARSGQGGQELRLPDPAEGRYQHRGKHEQGQEERGQKGLWQPATAVDEEEKGTRLTF